MYSQEEDHDQLRRRKPSPIKLPSRRNFEEGTTSTGRVSELQPVQSGLRPVQSELRPVQSELRPAQNPNDDIFDFDKKRALDRKPQTRPEQESFNDNAFNAAFGKYFKSPSRDPSRDLSQDSGRSLRDSLLKTSSHSMARSSVKKQKIAPEVLDISDDDFSVSTPSGTKVTKTAKELLQQRLFPECDQVKKLLYPDYIEDSEDSAKSLRNSTAELSEIISSVKVINVQLGDHKWPALESCSEIKFTIEENSSVLDVKGLSGTSVGRIKVENHSVDAIFVG